MSAGRSELTRRTTVLLRQNQDQQRQINRLARRLAKLEPNERPTHEDGCDCGHTSAAVGYGHGRACGRHPTNYYTHGGKR